VQLTGVTTRNWRQSWDKELEVMEEALGSCNFEATSKEMEVSLGQGLHNF
jgi:hypothetical protein